MNIILTHTPNDYELAYGKVIVSLFNNDYATDTNYRMGVRILDADDNLIGDVRQLPNPSGYCHFDISSVLRNHVDSRPNMESIVQLSTGLYEVFDYKISYGSIPFGGEFVQTSVVSDKLVLNGRKANTVVDWDSTDYKITISEQPGGPTITYNRIDGFQKALTDFPFEITTGANVTNKPTWVADTSVVNKAQYLRGTDLTLSFLNDWIASPTVADWTNGINGVYLAVYNGPTVLYNNQILNIQSNGGGPNETYSDETAPTGEYRLITAQVGDNSSVISTHLETATHFYVGTSTLIYDPEFATGYGLTSEVYRFDVNDGECNDFDNIQVSWLNSFGTRDYFDFQKRNDYEVNVTRETYQKLDANWASNEIEVYPYNRGKTVFNQSAKETYTVNTRYLSDIESQYLKNLYISPDVRVRIDGVWYPAILTSNTWTEKTYRKDRLFQHTISFELANPIQIQHG